MSKTYADFLIDTLAKQGVRHIYGLVGDSLNPIVDAVRRHKDMEWIHVHNEESAAFAAGAESLVTGELAVCAASCGPGNTHLVQGLYDAHRNGARVLALATHIPSEEIGTGFFQETHPQEVLKECSGYIEVAHTAKQGQRILHTAIQNSIGNKQVSTLVIPGNIAAENVDEPVSGGVVARKKGQMIPDAAGVDKLVAAIDKAEKITLFVGAGSAGAHDEIIDLATHLHAPIGHALGGKEVIQYDNPYDVGMSGLLGYGACYDACQDADLLLMLGTDFPYVDFLPDGSDVVIAQVDNNPEHLGRRAVLSHAICGDVLPTVNALLEKTKKKTDRSFLDAMLKKHERELTHVVDAYTKNVEKHTPIHPEFLADQIDELLDDDAVVTVDTGMCNVWAARYINPTGRNRVIGSWKHGTMANALAQAIGVQQADRNRQVVSFSGDGGLAMLMGELLTVRRNNLPVKTVVFNNSSLGMVKLEMLVEGMPEFGTDHDGVDYAGAAEALGIPSVRITDPKKARQQLKEALEMDGPVLIDVITDPNALSMPPTLEFEQLKGFALAAGRTVLDGGVGKMLSMARSNLRNIPRP